MAISLQIQRVTFANALALISFCPAGDRSVGLEAEAGPRVTNCKYTPGYLQVNRREFASQPALIELHLTAALQ